MNKKTKIIALALLTWLISANTVVFAAEALPQIESPFSSPASGASSSSSSSSDSGSIPSLKPKTNTSTTTSSDSGSIPSLNKKTESASGSQSGTANATSGTNGGSNGSGSGSGSYGVTDGTAKVLNDQKPKGKVVPAAEKDKKYTEKNGGDSVTADGAIVVAPKPKKINKSGPEAAFLILPSLMLGYLYNRKRK